MRPPPLTGNHPEALEMAKALGLDTTDLFRFIFDVSAGEPITVTAFYSKIISYKDAPEIGTVIKRFHVTNQIYDPGSQSQG